jgi:hypothetical protein
MADRSIPPSAAFNAPTRALRSTAPRGVPKPARPVRPGGRETVVRQHGEHACLLVAPQLCNARVVEAVDAAPERRTRSSGASVPRSEPSPLRRIDRPETRAASPLVQSRHGSVFRCEQRVGADCALDRRARVATSERRPCQRYALKARRRLGCHCNLPWRRALGHRARSPNRCATGSLLANVPSRPRRCRRRARIRRRL